MGNASKKLTYYIPLSPSIAGTYQNPITFVLKSNVFGHTQQHMGFFTQSWGATNFTIAFPLSKLLVQLGL